VTASPCYHCFKTIMNTGIRRVYYARPYKIHRLGELVRHANIEMIHLPETVAP
jgi:dCMP deaminase